jgi:hypothetical protein
VSAPTRRNQVCGNDFLMRTMFTEMMHGIRFAYPHRQGTQQVSSLNLTASLTSWGLGLVTLNSPCMDNCQKRAQPGFSILSPSRSVPPLKRSWCSGTHGWCTSDSHGRDFERTSQPSTRLISYAKTLLPALFWRAQPHILGRKSRIEKSHSHTCQMADPTAPVRAGEHEGRESVLLRS